jgi:hypothetical protein
MKKVFIIGVLLLGAWTYEPMRERTYVPLFAQLGPLGQRLIAPSQEGAARQKGRHLLRLLIIELRQGRPLPEPRGFEEWARQRLNDPEAARDPWGAAYWYEREHNRITVGSRGPDGQRGTADDIVVTGTP